MARRCATACEAKAKVATVWMHRNLVVSTRLRMPRTHLIIILHFQTIPRASQSRKQCLVAHLARTYPLQRHSILRVAASFGHHDGGAGGHLSQQRVGRSTQARLGAGPSSTQAASSRSAFPQASLCAAPGGSTPSFDDKSTQHIGKSQSKRPHTMWKRPLTAHGHAVFGE
jgi:hypothetical protein